MAGADDHSTDHQAGAADHSADHGASDRGTWVLGVLVAGREIARNDVDINGIGLTNGGIGISFLAPFSQPLNIYYAFLTLAAVIFFISLWMYRVQIGKMLKAIRIAAARV